MSRQRRLQRDETLGPTQERIRQAMGFFTVAGRGRKERKFTMLDDALGRALMRSQIRAEDYSALRRYAVHWHAGGLAGPLSSVDLDRIYAIDPTGATRLARTEAQAAHRQAYYAARQELGRKLAWIADHVACFDTSLAVVGRCLGYRSAAHGRTRAAELLAEAGAVLLSFWGKRDRTR